MSYQYFIKGIKEITMSEADIALQEFRRICPPRDENNLDDEWLTMFGFFWKGWQAKAIQVKGVINMKKYFIVKANYQTKSGDCVIEVLDDGEHIVQLFAYPCDDREAEKQAYRAANEYVDLLKGYE